jgi:hypothetical protein
MENAKIAAYHKKKETLAIRKIEEIEVSDTPKARYRASCPREDAWRRASFDRMIDNAVDADVQRARGRAGGQTGVTSIAVVAYAYGARRVLGRVKRNRYVAADSQSLDPGAA